MGWRSAESNAETLRVARAGEVLDGPIERQSVEHETGAKGQMASEFNRRIGALAGANRNAIAIEPRVSDFEAAARDCVIDPSPRSRIRALDAELRGEGNIEGAEWSAGHQANGGTKGLAKGGGVAATAADVLHSDGGGERNEIT